MLTESLLALAQFTGQTVAAAAIGDGWESARHKFARLLGRDDLRKTEVAERWLAETHEQLASVRGEDLERVRVAQAQRWEDRFADLLDQDPSVEADLRSLTHEVQAALPGGVVSVAHHVVAAARDVKMNADRGGIAAGVIHGNVTPGPTRPGSPGK